MTTVDLRYRGSKSTDPWTWRSLKIKHIFGHSYCSSSRPVPVIVKMDVMGADCDNAVTSMQENAFSSLHVFLIFALDVLHLNILHFALWAWNNGKEVPRWGVAEIQKMSPSTTGRCSRHAAAVLSNKGVGSANQWERCTATRQPITRTYYICCPDVVGCSVFAVQA